MKSISLKLKDGIYKETERLLAVLDVSRNSYINEAVKYYNEYQRRKLLEKQLIQESQLISEDSMRVLKEFESLEDER